MSTRRCRSGVALAAAMYAVVVIGMIVGAVLFTAVQSRRATDGGARDAVLVAAAQHVLLQGLTGWSGAARARQDVGTTETQRVMVPGPMVIDGTLRITRLNASVYWLTADAALPTDARLRRADPLQRRLTLLVRVPDVELPVRGAIVAAGDAVLGTEARVEADSSDASCGETDSALVLPSTAQLVLDPLAPSRPSVRYDDVASDPRSYASIGGESWATLVARADIVLPPDARLTPLPTISNGECAAGVANWGDPARAAPAGPCESRAPLVYAAGDLTLDGGSGQGVLLVEGRLHLGGPLLFEGLIIARGGVDTFADGPTISGMVLSAAGEGLPTSVALAHRITIRYSRCDVAHGIASTLRARPVRLRAWAETF